MKRVTVSNNVIRRLPRYLRKLGELEEQGVARISSKELGESLGLTPSQIRQDFSCFGEFGQQGYGYNVTDLKGEIKSILGMDRGYHAILVGAGNIGRALLDNFSFSEWGITMDCAFDIKEALVGTSFKGVEIKSASEMADYIDNNTVDLAVLSVPKEKAVEVAKELIENGVNAIWNFTNVELTEPNSPVLVENIHFSDSLLSLSYFISEANDEKAAREQRLRIRNV